MKPPRALPSTFRYPKAPSGTQKPHGRARDRQRGLRPRHLHSGCLSHRGPQGRRPRIPSSSLHPVQRATAAGSKLPPQTPPSRDFGPRLKAFRPRPMIAPGSRM
jgi:hypothetical protein